MLGCFLRCFFFVLRLWMEPRSVVFSARARDRSPTRRYWAHPPTFLNSKEKWMSHGRSDRTAAASCILLRFSSSDRRAFLTSSAEKVPSTAQEQRSLRWGPWDVHMIIRIEARARDRR